MIGSGVLKNHNQKCIDCISRFEQVLMIWLQAELGTKVISRATIPAIIRGRASNLQMFSIEMQREDAI